MRVECGWRAHYCSFLDDNPALTQYAVMALLVSEIDSYHSIHVEPPVRNSAISAAYVLSLFTCVYAFSNEEVAQVSSSFKCPRFMRRYGRVGRNPSRLCASLRPLTRRLRRH